LVGWTKKNVKNIATYPNIPDISQSRWPIASHQYEADDSIDIAEKSNTLN